MLCLLGLIVLQFPLFVYLCVYLFVCLFVCLLFLQSSFLIVSETLGFFSSGVLCLSGHKHNVIPPEKPFAAIQVSLNFITFQHLQFRYTIYYCNIRANIGPKFATIAFHHIFQSKSQRTDRQGSLMVQQQKSTQSLLPPNLKVNSLYITFFNPAIDKPVSANLKAHQL